MLKVLWRNRMDIEKKLLPEEQRRKLPGKIEKLSFGRIFTDHMFLMEAKNGNWQNARIQPFENLSLSPASMVFHYGQEIFEGMKAFYQTRTHGVSLFRPEMNAERLITSAKRMAMEPLPKEYFLEAIHQLVSLEHHWVPTVFGSALYIRPTEIATEAAIGLRSSKEYLFYVILSPVGPYFSEGFKPISIFVEPEYIRAVKGGTGEAKTGGNYAASLLALQNALKAGCDQVLWLDAIEHKYVEEVGTMNQFFVIDDVIYTAPLEGTILRGVTRDSVITLARDNGYKVKEQPLSIDTIIESIDGGNLTEAFGAGTAASIAPVGKLVYKGKKYVINNNQVGEITKTIYEKLTSIQYGKIDDPYNWNVPIKE